jgi:hypothetical protein
LLAGNVFDEIKIARRTAAIFGRTSAFTSQEARILCVGLDTNFFDDDSMFPVVAKIVDVTKFSYS